jgi:hypothetical protein
MRDRVGPARAARALDTARPNPPASIHQEEAAAKVRGVLDSIGDTSLDCRPEN